MDQTSDFLNHLTGTVSGDDRLRYFSEAGELKEGTKAGYKTLDEIFQAMKGYKEYTFAIRQSGTSAPTISVIKDDFGLETPLSFTYEGVGYYKCDITSLSLDLEGINNLNISNQASGFLPAQGEMHTYGYIDVAGNRIIIFTTLGDTTTRANSVLSNYAGVEISIREVV